MRWGRTRYIDHSEYVPADRRTSQWSLSLAIGWTQFLPFPSSFTGFSLSLSLFQFYCHVLDFLWPLFGLCRWHMAPDGFLSSLYRFSSSEPHTIRSSSKRFFLLERSFADFTEFFGLILFILGWFHLHANESRSSIAVGCFTSFFNSFSFLVQPRFVDIYWVFTEFSGFNRRIHFHSLADVVDPRPVKWNLKELTMFLVDCLYAPSNVPKVKLGSLNHELRVELYRIGLC